MCVYGFFKRIITSFYSTELYRDVAKKWTGSALGFFFCVTLLFTFLHGLQFHKKIVQIDVKEIARVEKKLSNPEFAKSFKKRDTNDLIAYLVSQIPEITFKGGEAKTKTEQPYHINMPSGSVFMTIDVRKEDGDSKHFKGFVMLNGDFLKVKSGSKIIPTSLKKLIGDKQELVLNKAAILNFLDEYKDSIYWMISSCFIFVSIVVTYIFAIIQAIILSVIGAIYSMFSSKKLGFGARFRLSVVAQVPATTLAFFVPLASPQTTVSDEAYFIISLLYFFYGICRCVHSKK